MKSILSRLRTRPAAAALQDGAEIGRLYRAWRIRVLYATTGGYALFYFVRNNLGMATPAIVAQYGFSNTQWGLLLSASTIVYAFSKFASGLLADVANPRYLLPIGLFLSALANICFGFGTGLGVFTAFWMLSSAFSGVGVPPCARLLTHWFSPREIGRAWGVWNASHQIGGAVIAIWAGYLVAHFGWRSAFWAPAALAIAASFWLFNRLADSPESLGLPPIEIFEGQARNETNAPASGRTGEAVPSKGQAQNGKPESFWSVFRTNILTNKGVWIVSTANFFVYVVRIGILSWSPKYLTEAKHLTLINAGFCVFSFEVAGMFGAYVSGWLSDRVFMGRRGPVSTAFMFVLVGLVLALFRVTNGDGLTLGLIFAGLGFFVYGPQMLVAVAATDYSTRVASASAVGLTGLLGYLGATFCGLATGWLVDTFGWDSALWLYAGSAAAGCLLLATTCPRRSAG
jgi:sugar phosphate permease